MESPGSFFNRECWLMLLGFPLDYRSSEYLHATIGSFGRLILWEEDRHNVTRTLLRVRVTSLEEVPQFIVFSKAEGFIGASWTMQCEIIQQNMLGGQPQDEDPVPEALEDGQQLPLAFFWSGSTFASCCTRPQLPTGSVGGDVQAQPDDNVQGDWDQRIANIQPEQQIQHDIQPDEQHISNQHSGLSSDSSVGLNQGAPLQNGQILEDHLLVGPIVPVNVSVVLALGVAPMNGPQEVDGPVIQLDPHAMDDGQPPEAPEGGIIIIFCTMWNLITCSPRIGNRIQCSNCTWRGKGLLSSTGFGPIILRLRGT
jgi:hypothetical protein